LLGDFETPSFTCPCQELSSYCHQVNKMVISDSSLNTLRQQMFIEFLHIQLKPHFTHTA